MSFNTLFFLLTMALDFLLKDSNVIRTVLTQNGISCDAVNSKKTIQQEVLLMSKSFSFCVLLEKRVADRCICEQFGTVNQCIPKSRSLEVFA